MTHSNSTTTVVSSDIFALCGLQSVFLCRKEHKPLRYSPSQRFRGKIMSDEKIILDEQSVNRALARIAHEITERNKGVENVVLIGVVTRGVPMAKILADNIAKFEGVEVPVGSIDISLYRDDITEKYDHPVVNGTSVDFDVKNKVVVLCDDVIFTGRTARAAMEATLAMGRPASIQLAVLVDRGHRELPIRADFVGKNMPTKLSEKVAVNFFSTDGEQNVKLASLE